MCLFSWLSCCSNQNDETTPILSKSKKWNGLDVEDVRSGEIKVNGTEIYVRGAGQKSSEVQGWVRRLLNGEKMTLYRAMSAYHPNFKFARLGQVQPLGEGKSSFDTGSSAWTAWQWDFDLAISIAASTRGMDIKDRIEDVVGYDKSDSEFEIGVVLSIQVDQNDSLTFYNATEVQVLGAQRAKVEAMLKMGTLLTKYDALRLYASNTKKTLADIMPDKD